MLIELFNSLKYNIIVILPIQINKLSLKYIHIVSLKHKNYTVKMYLMIKITFKMI